DQPARLLFGSCEREEGARRGPHRDDLLKLLERFFPMPRFGEGQALSVEHQALFLGTTRRGASALPERRRGERHEGGGHRTGLDLDGAITFSHQQSGVRNCTQKCERATKSLSLVYRFKTTSGRSRGSVGSNIRHCPCQ